jgi:hypothetical protein
MKTKSFSLFLPLIFSLLLISFSACQKEQIADNPIPPSVIEKIGWGGFFVDNQSYNLYNAIVIDWGYSSDSSTKTKDLILTSKEISFSIDTNFFGQPRTKFSGIGDWAYLNLNDTNSSNSFLIPGSYSFSNHQTPRTSAYANVLVGHNFETGFSTYEYNLYRGQFDPVCNPSQSNYQPQIFIEIHQMDSNSINEDTQYRINFNFKSTRNNSIPIRRVDSNFWGQINYIDLTQLTPAQKMELRKSLSGLSNH